MRSPRIPIAMALSIRGAKIYCNGQSLRIVAPGWGCRYCAPYPLTIDNLSAVYDAGMVCELDPAPAGASAVARALVDW